MKMKKRRKKGGKEEGKRKGKKGKIVFIYYIAKLQFLLYDMFYQHLIWAIVSCCGLDKIRMKRKKEEKGGKEEGQRRGKERKDCIYMLHCQATACVVCSTNI